MLSLEHVSRLEHTLLVLSMFHDILVVQGCINILELLTVALLAILDRVLRRTGQYMATTLGE